MKKNKFVSLILVLLLMASMVISAYADGSSTGGTGTITIQKGVSGKNYKLYQLFVLNSYNTENNNNQYSYTVNSNWTSFFAMDGAGYEYIHLENGHPTWQVEENVARAEAFAISALSYASQNNILPSFEGTCQDTGLSFTAVPYGYYLLDSAVGTLCSLGTNAPDLTIEEKNEAPGVTKTTKLPGQTDEQYGPNNTAAIGTTVDFRSVVNVGKGTTDYVYHDKATGLTINGPITVKVNGQDVATKNYTVTMNPTDGCTFEVRFRNDYIFTLAANSSIFLTYQGTVNKDAVTVGKNDAWVNYDNATNVTHSETHTETFAFDILKVNQQNKQLPDAVFELYNGNGAGAQKIELVWDQTQKGYRPALVGETPENITTKGSVIRVFGLDKKVYYLKEVTAPRGYNLLADMVEVDLTGGNQLSQQQAGGTPTGGIRIENHAGTLLPTTGGMGTTVFYLVGGILAAAALVLLISRKRMEREK